MSAIRNERRVIMDEGSEASAAIYAPLAEQIECRVEEGHLVPDHMHMLLSVPPKHAVSQVAGYIKEMSAIHLARTHGGRRRNFVDKRFF